MSFTRQGGLRSALRTGLQPNAGIPYLIGPGYFAGTFSRAQAGGAQSTYIDASGALQYAAADTARFNGTARRLLTEEIRTNLFLNSAALGTQDVTVVATNHAVSFYGTGTIAFSGAYVGSLVGTGAGVRSKLLFLPAAGVLTCAVTGDVRLAQLEARNWMSSYIPTDASVKTIGADLTTVPFASRFPHNVGTAVFSFVPLNGNNTGNNGVFSINGAGSKRIELKRTPGDGHAIIVQDGGTSNVLSFISATLGSRRTVGITFDAAGRTYAVADGGVSTTGPASPITGLTAITVGRSADNVLGNNEIGPLYTLPYVVSDAVLLTRVTAMHAAG